MTARIAVLLLALVLPTAAQAQLFRAYLALDGSDANPCTLPAPCRLLPAAIAAVASGGQIWLLDSANYNSATVNITKSVTILAVPGAVGSVVATGGPAINIATAGVIVTLRNLVVGPLPGGGGTMGINMTDGQRLTVENCLFSNLAQTAISVSTDAQLTVFETTIRDNVNQAISLSNGPRAVVSRSLVTDNGSYGILVSGGTLPMAVDIGDTTFSRNLVGFYANSTSANSTINASVHASRFVDNDNGVLVVSAAGAAVRVSISGSTVANNVGYGIQTGGAGSRVWAAGNTVSGNFVGISQGQSGGVFETTQTNAVRNNTTNKEGVITVVAME